MASSYSILFRVQHSATFVLFRMKADTVSGELLSSKKTVPLIGPIRAFSLWRVSIIERMTRANGTGPVRLPRLYVCMGLGDGVSVVGFPCITIEVVFVTFARGKELLSWHSTVKRKRAIKPRTGA